ncbi:flagellin [Tistrella mobilis]|uniref:flagellin n=1 Tax=Tistrella mobilis TaxID=171437 RepID=UPI0035580942
MRGSIRHHAAAAVMGAAAFLSAATADAKSLDFDVTAYTDNQTLHPSFYCEQTGGSSTTLSYPYKASGIEFMGTTESGTCDVSTYLEPHSAFNFHAMAGSTSAREISYQINLYNDEIEGTQITQQAAQFFTYGNASYVLNYGITDLPMPFNDTAYLYIGNDQSDWMAELTGSSGYAGITFGDLVLPAAHDAGMFQISDSTAATSNLKGVCGTAVPAAFNFLCQEAEYGATALQNVSLTQKDVIYDQLRIGTRYFDIRPGYPIGDAKATDTNTTHIHNFIPGAPLAGMLDDVSRFLGEHTGEIVVLRIQSNGIDHGYYQFISSTDLTAALDRHIAAGIGYRLVDDLSTLSGQSLKSIVGAGKRVIVVYGAEKSATNPTGIPDINDSYDDNDYQASIHSPIAVNGDVATTLQACSGGGAQYTLLQLQDTASGALLPFYTQTQYTPLILDASEVIGNSDFGNILQGTKPWFDAVNYPWLQSSAALASLVACHMPVVIQNDFVDVALTSHAIGLSKYRHDN